MPPITYKDLHKDKWEYVVQAHYADEVKQAQALGFHEVYYVSETVAPFMLLLVLDSYIINRFFKKECCWINRRLQGIMTYPFLIHEEGYAYAVCLKQGAKYTTVFEDGTALQTTSYWTTVGNAPEHRYTRQRCKTGREDAWQMHKTSVEKLASENRTVMPVVNLQDALHIEMRIDEITALFAKTPDWGEREKNKEKQ